MTFLDIHAHILPAVDDGARDMETAIALLEMLKSQGVTHVVATPHFYPDTDNAEEFIDITQKAYKELTTGINHRDLPKVFLGCELRYFSGIGKSSAIKQFVISGTKYLLLELPYGAPITKTVLQDIIDINERQGLMPIFAHIERYGKAPGFKKLLKLVSDGYALAHINASAIATKEVARLCEKLVKRGYISYIASDTHSPKHRPPQFDKALAVITDRLGKSFTNRLIIKANQLLEEIENANEKQ